MDLCFTNNTEAYYETSIEETSLSDHNLIKLQVRYKRKHERFQNVDPTTGFRAYNFFSEDTNWNNLDKQLKNVNWKDVLSNLNPSECLDKILSTVLSCCEGNVPHSRKSSPRKHHIPKRNRILMRRRKIINQRLTRAKMNEQTKHK